MRESTRQFVRDRAGHRCEYCHLSQDASPFLTFHIEHIRARQHGGDDEPLNLALACPDCNSYKGPNLTGIDPESDDIVLLFNPRVQSWDDHFAIVGAEIVGTSAPGRASVRVLDMNEDERVMMRSELQAEGLW